MMRNQNVKKCVGQRLQQLRKQANMTQQELADASGVHRTYISNAENGRRNLTFGLIDDLCRCMGVTLVEFFDDEIFKGFD